MPSDAIETRVDNADLKRDFIKEVHAAARSRYTVDVFADMVRAMAGEPVGTLVTP